jgi:hypothetical protein
MIVLFCDKSQKHVKLSYFYVNIKKDDVY